MCFKSLTWKMRAPNGFTMRPHPSDGPGSPVSWLSLAPSSCDREIVGAHALGTLSWAPSVNRSFSGCSWTPHKLKKPSVGTNIYEPLQKKFFRQKHAQTTAKKTRKWTAGGLCMGNHTRQVFFSGLLQGIRPGATKWKELRETSQTKSTLLQKGCHLSLVFDSLRNTVKRNPSFIAPRRLQTELQASQNAMPLPVGRR